MNTQGERVPHSKEGFVRRLEGEGAPQVVGTGEEVVVVRVVVRYVVSDSRTVDVVETKVVIVMSTTEACRLSVGERRMVGRQTDNGLGAGANCVSVIRNRGRWDANTGACGCKTRCCVCCPQVCIA